MSFLNLNVASNCETELQENHPAEAEDISVSSLLQTADEKNDASQGQILYRVALLAMCLLSAVSLGLTLLMLFGVLHVGSPRCTCSGETGICRFTRCFILNFNSYLQIDRALDTLLFWINFRCESESAYGRPHKIGLVR